MFRSTDGMFKGAKKMQQNRRDGRMSSDTFSNRKLFFLITTFLSLLATADDLDEAIEEFIKVDGDIDFIHKLFIYLKLPKDMLENLLSEDELVSKGELGLLKNYIFDLIGNGSIYEFADFAIDNEPSIEALSMYDADGTDGFDMDWSFFKDKKSCKRQLSKKKSGEFSKTCESGQKGGVSGFWLYPTDFESKETHGVSGSNHKSRSSYPTKPHKKQKDTKENIASEKKDKKIGDKRAKEHGVKSKSSSLNSKTKEDLFKAVGV